MKRKFIHKTISLIMAFLLLVTSSGISMDVHFCQGHFKRANIFDKAKSCAEVNACLIKCGKKVSSCSADKGCSSDGDHKGCCHNESFDFDLEFDSIEIIPDVNIENSLSSIYTGYSFIEHHIIPSSRCLKFINYIPPPPEKDIAILFQVFRL